MGMHQAAEAGEVEPLKVAIDGAYNAYKGERIKPDINGKNKKGRIALHLAICNHRLDVTAVRVLLEKGANPNSLDGAGLSPLHVIAGMCPGMDDHQREHFESRVALQCARLLLHHKADPNGVATTEHQPTALHMAAAGGHLSLVKLLLKKGAQPNVRDASGATPLHYAARELRARVALELIEGGADPTISDAQGAVARDAATAPDSQSSAIRKHIDGAAELRRGAIEVRKQARLKRGEAAKQKAEL